MRKYYHKLVRDKIPQIIADSGSRCVTEVLSEEDYLRMLDQKLEEEMREYLADHALEELADLLEVLEAIVRAKGHTWEELLSVKEEKYQNRGGFEEKLLLKEVISE